MAVTAKQIPKEQGIFTKIWEIYKKYYDAPNTDDTWNKLINEVNSCAKENDNHILAVKLGIAILEVKEDMEKKKISNK